MTPNASPSQLSSPAREVLAGLCAFATALVCVLPPILHFLTAPLGPLIGGAVASKLVSRTMRARVIVAVTMGALMTGAIAAVVTVLRKLGGEPAKWLADTDVIALAIAGVAIYTAGLGACGVALGHTLAEQKQTAQAQTAEAPPG